LSNFSVSDIVCTKASLKLILDAEMSEFRVRQFDYIMYHTCSVLCIAVNVEQSCVELLLLLLLFVAIDIVPSCLPCSYLFPSL